MQSLDFFMPIVDDPADFGRIAAANALSDLYAMGAAPAVALAILGLPIGKLGPEVGAAILAGAGEVCAEAGIAIAGGHSIDDAEPKFGLSVTGTVHPERVWRNDTGRPGDLLVLTKPLGTGTLAHAMKHRGLDDDRAAMAVATMIALNAGAARAAARVGITAATDVTGFGLLGHAHEMAARLGVDLYVGALPVLPGTSEFIEAGVHPGATRRNLAHYGPATRWEPGLGKVARKLVADPQTSGGLLLAVAPERVEALRAELAREGALAAAVVGRLSDAPGVRVHGGPFPG